MAEEQSRLSEISEKDIKAMNFKFKRSGYRFFIVDKQRSRHTCSACKVVFAVGMIATCTNTYTYYHLECHIKHIEGMIEYDIRKNKARNKWLRYCKKVFPRYYKINVLAQL